MTTAEWVQLAEKPCTFRLDGGLVIAKPIPPIKPYLDFPQFIGDGIYRYPTEETSKYSARDALNLLAFLKENEDKLRAAADNERAMHMVTVSKAIAELEAGRGY